MICITDLEGCFKTVNPIFEKTLGFRKQELVTKSFLNFIHPDDVEKTQLELLKMKNNRVSTKKFENRYITKKGKIVYLQWNSSINWENNSIFSIARDVTSLKNIGEGLTRSEKLLLALEKTAKIGIWHFEYATKQINWSNEMYRIFEFKKSRQLNLYEACLTRLSEEDKLRYQSLIENDTLKRDSISYEHEIYLPENRRKNIQSTIIFVKNANNKIGQLYGITQDITDFTRIQQQTLKNLSEKELLIRELYHREKNNLQVISSLLNLQAHFSSSKKVKEILQESQLRIKSMASIHDLLLKSGNLLSINFRSYIKKLTTELLATYIGNQQKIKLQIDVPENIHFNNEKVIPLGLLINEIITNSFKHAFVTKQEGKLFVSFSKLNKSEFVLKIADDGTGFDLDQPKKTLGLMLISHLCDQIGGVLRGTSTKNGTSYEIILPASL